MTRPINLNPRTNPDREVYDFLVVDASGSMMPKIDSTLTGINTYLAKMREDAKKLSTEGKAFTSIIFFNTLITVHYSFVPIQEVQDITRANYVASGFTALNDAVAGAIESLKERLKGREDSDDVDVTITVFTDGYENASKKYTTEQLKGYIEEVKSSWKWTVNYVGAGDSEQAMAAATQLGIAASNVAHYADTSVGTTTMFTRMATARSMKTMDYMTTGAKSATGYFVPPSTTTDVPQTTNTYETTIQNQKAEATFKNATIKGQIDAYWRGAGSQSQSESQETNTQTQEDPVNDAAV